MITFPTYDFGKTLFYIFEHVEMNKKNILYSIQRELIKRKIFHDKRELFF